MRVAETCPRLRLTSLEFRRPRIHITFVMFNAQSGICCLQFYSLQARLVIAAKKLQTCLMLGSKIGPGGAPRRSDEVKEQESNRISIRKQHFERGCKPSKKIFSTTKHAQAGAP